MDLQRGRGGLEHDVLVLQGQMFGTLDIERDRAPVAQPEHLVVQGLVTLQRRHVGDYQIAAADRRQDTDQQGAQPQPCRDLLAATPACEQGIVHGIECPGAEGQGVGVEFEIEPRQFRHDIGVVDRGEKILVLRRRVPVTVDQPGLDLEAEAPLGRAQSTLGKPFRQQARLHIEAPAKLGEGRFVEIAAGDLLSHAD